MDMRRKPALVFPPLLFPFPVFLPANKKQRKKNRQAARDKFAQGEAIAATKNKARRSSQKG
jgi:hypothetical protein